MLSVKSTTCRPVSRAPKSCSISRPRFVVVAAQPATSVPEIEKKIEAAIKDAEKECSTGTAKDCAVAWDTVEELSAAAAHKKVAAKADPLENDPLEKFCKENPETDECRVYDD